MLHGAAGTAVGSRIKGHEKRGGSKMTKQHRQQATVAHTNENRTNRLCSWCFYSVFLSRGQRIRDGKATTVRLSGAVDCRSPLCPRKQAGLGSMGRDSNAAPNIGISSASILLSADHSALPFFRPFSLPSHQQHQQVSGQHLTQDRPVGYVMGLLDRQCS